jgi:anthranilate phosphoribosyltransferase
LSGETSVAELKNGEIQHYSITAQQFGFPAYTDAELQTGLGASSADASERLMREALNNVPGPARDIVAINAAGALLASDCAASWDDAVTLAMQVLASGEAKKKLDVFVSTTQRLAGHV